VASAFQVSEPARAPTPEERFCGRGRSTVFQGFRAGWWAREMFRNVVMNNST
jgi:hypothetical protein